MNKIVVISVEELGAMLEEKLKKGTAEPKLTPLGDQFLDMVEACTFLKIAKQTLYGYTSNRLIPYIKRGKKLYFKRSVLEQWLEDGAVKSRKEILEKGI